MPTKVATQVAFEPSGKKRNNFAVMSLEPVAKKGKVGWNVKDLIISVCIPFLLFNVTSNVGGDILVVLAYET